MKVAFTLPNQLSTFDLLDHAIQVNSKRNAWMITIISVKNKEALTEVGEWFLEVLHRLPKMEYRWHNNYNGEIHCWLEFDLDPAEVTLFNLRWK